MKRLSLCVVCLLLVVTASHAAVEMWIDRVEERGRLLVPVRGIFEATGALVEWNPAERSVHITYGGSIISMWVNSTLAMIDGYEVYLDVPPRNIGGRVHIPLRFVGESLGRTVNYTGDTVVLADPYADDIVLYLMGSQPPPSRGEILPQSDNRHLNNGDLAGMSNWRLTLARNEIYARYGRPFDNSHVRSHFQSTGWYVANSDFRESWLAQFEQRNAVFIREYQEAVFGQPATRP